MSIKLFCRCFHACDALALMYVVSTAHIEISPLINNNIRVSVNPPWKHTSTFKLVRTFEFFISAAIFAMTHLNPHAAMQQLLYSHPETSGSTQ